MAPEPPTPLSEDEAQKAYLFHCLGDGELHAISLDSSARNITARQCPCGWVLDGEVIVGVQEALPLALDPEPVLRGLRSMGFYVWKAPLAPHATTQ